MIKIAPSILSADFTRLQEEVRAVEQGGADMLHVDIMDGHFVPNLTFGPIVVKALRRSTTLPLDVHLMISPVDPFLDAFVEAGADTITVHAEATPHLDRTLQRIRELGCQAGVALNPATPICWLDHLLNQDQRQVDLVLLMSVNPGFGGQSFLPSALGKIRTVRKRLETTRHEIALEIDGGIKPDNIHLAAAAGADVFVAGSAVFSQPSNSYSAIIQRLRERATAEKDARTH